MCETTLGKVLKLCDNIVFKFNMIIDNTIKHTLSIRTGVAI